MIKSILIVAILSSCNHIYSAEFLLKYDFGSGEQKPGYVKVEPNTTYTEKKGFGFDFGTSVKSVTRKGGDSLKDDFCYGEKPFYFSVNVPEGNYRVRVVLGDREGESKTTVKAESRRLMLENIETKTGEIKTYTFNVNVRYPEIGNGKMVKLKTREKDHLNWDHKLSLEFNNARPCVCGIEIEKIDNAITVYLAGDSTVTDQKLEPWSSWGQILPRFLGDGVVISNHAESGETFAGFYGERRFEKIFSQMKAGNYLFIQFAHNDMKRRGEGIGPFESYKKYIEETIDNTRKHEGIPVLVTSMHRRSFKNGKIVNTFGDYPAAMRLVAKEKNVALIDLNRMSEIMFNAMGEEGSKAAFVHYPAGSFLNQPKALADNSHFSPYGAYQLAKCVIEGIKENKLGLAGFISDDYKEFNPMEPDDFMSFYIPASPTDRLETPEGS